MTVDAGHRRVASSFALVAVSATTAGPSKHADLTEEPNLVEEQVFLHNLAVLPPRCRTPARHLPVL